MTSKKISILDYGVSNLLNVTRAIAYLGHSFEVINSPSQVLSSDMIILPGVGAFGDAMRSLQSTGLDQALIEFVKGKERPLFGICLGMQLLMETSTEFENCKGLNLIKGDVVKIPENVSSDKLRRVPHVGWSPLEFKNDSGNESHRNLFYDVKNGEGVYFVHSFMASNTNDVSSFTHYERLRIPASLAKDNIAAAQFHPERSGKVGLHILDNFIRYY